MCLFAYYVLTKQEYVLPEVRDREFLSFFHKKARKAGLDVNQYNRLKGAHRTKLIFVTMHEKSHLWNNFQNDHLTSSLKPSLKQITMFPWTM